MQAYAEGKDIQIKRNTGIWEDLDCPEFDDYVSEYRIRLKPRYRPFKSAEECWNEMLKHQPFGWVKTGDKSLFLITGIKPGVDEFMITVNGGDWYPGPMSMLFTFADGEPFGILES